jgi:hypothetical protein
VKSNFKKQTVFVCEKPVIATPNNVSRDMFSLYYYSYIYAPNILVYYTVDVKTTKRFKFLGIKKSALIKENQIFPTLSYIVQNGAVAESYMANGLLIYGEIFGHSLIYKEALPHI